MMKPDQRFGPSSFSSNDTISGAAHSVLTGSDSFSGACPQTHDLKFLDMFPW